MEKLNSNTKYHEYFLEDINFNFNLNTLKSSVVSSHGKSSDLTPIVAMHSEQDGFEPGSYK